MKLFKGKRKKGFTLVELMVVVGIIALLLLLVVPRLAGNTEKAKTRAFESNYRTLAADINVALADPDAAGEIAKVKAKAAGLADQPQGASYTIADATGSEPMKLTGKLGTYTLVFDSREGTTTATGDAPGKSFKTN